MELLQAPPAMLDRNDESVGGQDAPVQYGERVGTDLVASDLRIDDFSFGPTFENVTVDPAE